MDTRIQNFDLKPWAKWPALLLSASLALSGAVFALLAAFHPPKPVFPMLGFEVIAAVAGAFGVLIALGRFRSGPALGLAMVAAFVFAGTVLGYLAASGKRDFFRPTGTLGTIPIGPLLIGRVLITLALGGVAALVVLTRDRRSWGRLFRAMACGVPVLVGAALFMKFGLGPLGTPQGGMLEVARIVGILLAALLALVLVAAAGHLLIRAFEITREPPPAPPAPAA